MRILAFLLAAHLCCAAPAEEAPPEETSPACLEARDHSDLDWIEQNIFAPSCYGDDDPRIDPSVGTMPASNDLLCGEKREAVSRWIAALTP